MKKTLYLTLIISLTALSCKKDAPVEEPTFEVIQILTDFGNIYLDLYEETPLHQHNFDSLVRAAYYDSTEFHRCVNNFVIQGGSPSSKDDNRNNDGSGSLGYTLNAEIDS